MNHISLLCVMWLAGFHSCFNNTIGWSAISCSTCRNLEDTKCIRQKAFPREMLGGQESEDLYTTGLTKITIFCHRTYISCPLSEYSSPLSPVFAYSFPFPAFISYRSPPQYPQSTPSPWVPNPAYSSSSR